MIVCCFSYSMAWLMMLVGLRVLLVQEDLLVEDLMVVLKFLVRFLSYLFCYILYFFFFQAFSLMVSPLTQALELDFGSDFLEMLLVEEFLILLSYWKALLGGWRPVGFVVLARGWWCKLGAMFLCTFETGVRGVLYQLSDWVRGWGRGRHGT